jgi:transposase
MSLVKQLDKRSGLTYVYESKSYWNKEKQQSRSKRTLVGRLDPLTGEIVPTDGRGRRRGNKETLEKSKTGPVPATHAERLFYGATYLFDQIGEITGVKEDLKTCFPTIYKQILSLAYYLILEDQNPLFRFKKWGMLHHHPHGKDIPSQRSSEIFSAITEEAKMQFFRLQGKRRAEKEYWAYDSTSISSCSKLLRKVRCGKNRDGDRLPQINLLLLFGETSGLPFYYRSLAGNIPDVKTVKHLISQLDVLGYEKVKLVMDRGYYSADNINALCKAHLKFLCSTSTVLSFVKSFINEVGLAKDEYTYYDSNLELYVFSKTIAWDYEEKRPYKGDVIKRGKRMYLHLYFNPEQQVEDAKVFNKKLTQLKDEILSGRRLPENEKDYAKYFEIKETPKRGVSLSVKEEAVRAAKERFGFFALLSNDVKDPVVALELYRTRDVVEKAFWNIKERLNLRRTLVSSESSLEGKLFVEFIALIYLSYIKKKMEEKKMFGKYTMHEMLDELDVIECFKEPGKGLRTGEVLKKQEQIYLDLGVKPLTASS